MNRKSLLRGGGVMGGLVVAATAWLLFAPTTQLDEQHHGLPADFAPVAQVAFASRPQAFAAGEDKDHSRDNVRLWDAVRKVASPRKPMGADHWPGPQQTGDCVPMGLVTAVVHTAAADAVAHGRTTIDDPFQPYNYGTARTLTGRTWPPCGEPGAYPTEAAEAFEQLGWISYSEAGVSYSGSLADAWGCRGPPAALKLLGKKRSGGSWYPIRSLDEWQNAVCSGFSTTVAIPTFNPAKPVVQNGRWVITAFRPCGRCGHQVAAIGFDGSTGKRYWCLFNSHGSGWPQGCPPMQGEPRGSCWIDERTAQWILDNGAVIAVSSVPGFKPKEIDWSAFDLAAASATPANELFTSKELARANPKTVVAP